MDQVDGGAEEEDTGKGLWVGSWLGVGCAEFGVSTNLTLKGLPQKHEEGQDLGVYRTSAEREVWESPPWPTNTAAAELK